MPYQAFIKIAGVTTETSDGYIEIVAWSFGASNPSTVGTGASGGGSGKVSFSDFHVTKVVDGASPDIFKLAIAGTIIPTVMLQVRKETSSGGSGSVYFSVTFSNVLIAMYTLGEGNPGNDSGQNALPKESISFNFEGIEFTYHPQG